jgi:hypothetical protein
LDVFADVDHTGDDLARDLAVRLRDLGARLREVSWLWWRL